jgi:hypothetical protein
MIGHQRHGMRETRDKYQVEEQRNRALITVAVIALFAVLLLWPQI